MGVVNYEDAHAPIQGMLFFYLDITMGNIKVNI